MEKMAQIRQISIFFSKSSDFYDEVPVGTQEYRRIVVFSTFISSL
jgi:hypothetical protein